MSTKSKDNQTEDEVEAVIELVQLENGDIALRHSEMPDQPLVTMTFSDELEPMISGAKLDIARAMVEAGIQRQQEIQASRIKEMQQASTSGLLH